MKWFILKLVVAIIIATTFMGCTKFGKNITVKGRVLNPITNEPISGAKIGFIKNGNPFQYYGGYKAIKSVTSNENGEFEISAGRLGPVWAVTSYGDYQSIYHLGWDYNGKYYSMLKVDKGKTMHVDYHLVPYGKLRLNIKNINCEGQDTMWLRKKWEYDSDFGAWPYVYNLGCYNQMTGESKVPIGSYVYQIKVKRASGISYLNYYGAVYENQTTTIDVFY